MTTTPPREPKGAYRARQLPADSQVLTAYFEQVASFDADRRRSAQRVARISLAVGALGLVAGLAGVVSVAALAPLKTVVPLVFRVDNATGAVERVYDVDGGSMAATDAVTRHFLWQYVRLRQSYSPAEAQAQFEQVAVMSSPAVQNQYAEEYRGSNPNSPQVILGKDGAASVRWVSTSILGPKLAQVRFTQQERKGDTLLPPKRMIATIGFDYTPKRVSSATLNVNPLGFIVTSYRADQENTQ
ncbi:virB8 family protein [Methylobacterium radiotolerans]|uniref:virB8 family protein n=1 Tax=Methylobacterium radiotolerans TaxID=31998 RepID=UPI000977D326|nr:VirB8/TrbF family protein [Methylobacterium radiotolerans]ONF49432.1 hypothetical protein RSM1_09155 [Methylobacterium radiotolerans]